MNIDSDHLLFGPKVLRDLLPGGAAMPIRRLLVIHFTAGMSARSSIEFWKSAAAKGASAHVVIDRDGTIFQCRAFNRTAGHTGVSKWKDPSGTARSGCNAFSIGIELANAGDSVKGTIAAPKLFGKYPCAAAIQARHKNGGPASLWEVYPGAQLGACMEVSRALFARYQLDDVVGHEDIAPSRKNDPGPAFPMDFFRERLIGKR